VTSTTFNALFNDFSSRLSLKYTLENLAAQSYQFIILVEKLSSAINFP